MTLDDSIQAFRLRVLAAAARSGNVRATCARFGISRTQFYRLRRRLERYGPDGVHPKRHRPRRGRPAQVTLTDERRVVAMALAWPTRGPLWVHDQLRRDGLDLAPTTIWRVLHRHGLGTRRERLARLVAALLDSPETRHFVRVNTWEGIEWFGREEWRELLGWLAALAVVESVKAVEGDGATAGRPPTPPRLDRRFAALLADLAALAEAAGYRLDRLRELAGLEPRRTRRSRARG